MIKIAIVEDEFSQTELMREYVARYCKEKNIKYSITTFGNGLDFVTGYRPGFDAVFMDIKMPLIDGMEAAEKLREVDKDVVLIFVTNMAQLAIKGYKVNAMDFMVKPVSYFDFSLEMDKICAEHQRRSTDFVWVKSSGILRRVDYEDIYYIEIILRTKRNVRLNFAWFCVFFIYQFVIDMNVSRCRGVPAVVSFRLCVDCNKFNQL